MAKKRRAIEMTRERAIEVFKWAPHYCKPPLIKDEEHAIAIEYIESHPDTWNEIWRSK